MRNPNGYGSVKKLSGKRRRPYGVYITTGFEMSEKPPDIGFLKEILSEGTFELVKCEYEAYRTSHVPKAKQVQKCIGYFETRQEAMIALAEFNKTPYDLANRNMTFGNVFEILKEEKFDKMKYSAQHGYSTAYDKCSSIKNVKMIDIRKAHMQNILDKHSRSSKSTLNNLIKLFHAVFKFALENDVCEKDYSEFVEAASQQTPKQKRPFTKEEIYCLWNNIDKIEMLDLVLIQIYTGLRPAELLALNVEDVHLLERYIEVAGTKTKAADRIVPIHMRIVPLLEKRIGSRKSEPLFVGKANRRIYYEIYRKFFADALQERLNISHTPHECRHTFASIATACGLNDVLLKKMIGHSTGSLTGDVYTHAYINDLVREIDKFKV